ncbi:MAG: NAD(P)/FAD-dependent oxidoreductase [Methanomassiliicoccales archaeon]|nr:NAD(P)/FAD-dependent oxidoreductase [Methanomassiliicoccales archaeon]
MSGRRLVIVGGGVSGLSAGCFALMNGFEALILEQHSRLGGVATSWTRKGFRIDGRPAPIWGTMPGTILHDIYRELGIVPQNRLQTLTRLEVHDESSLASLDLAAGLEEVERSMKEISSSDAEVIEDLVDAAMEMSPELLPDIIASPSAIDLSGHWLGRLWRGRRINRYRSGIWRRPFSRMLEEIRSDALRRMVASLQNAESPAWLAAMHLSLAANRQLVTLQGGCSGLIDSLQQRFERLGGRLRVGCRADSILVGDGRVNGVRTSSEQVEAADWVITAAGGLAALPRMLEGPFSLRNIADRHRALQVSPPRVLVALGTSRPFDEVPLFNTILLRLPIHVGASACARMVLRNYTEDSSIAPPGKGLIQAELESDWQFWYKLRALDARMYEGEKARLAREVMARLETHLPGLTEKVEMTDVSTPFTTWRYTSNHEGSMDGWLPTRPALEEVYDRRVPGLGGLYLVGHWADVCWSLPQCLLSGRDAVRSICKDADLPFRATAPSLP